jgi:hypothetical protein
MPYREVEQDIWPLTSSPKCEVRICNSIRLKPFGTESYNPSKLASVLVTERSRPDSRSFWHTRRKARPRFSMGWTRIQPRL